MQMLSSLDSADGRHVYCDCLLMLYSTRISRSVAHVISWPSKQGPLKSRQWTVATMDL